MTDADRPFEVPSPCIGICALDPITGWCAGCFRTGGEIASWGGLSNDGKRAVIERLHDRRAEAGVPDRRRTNRRRSRPTG